MPTINGARGMSQLIADRNDLTLGAIRRYYAGAGTSPLHAAVHPYAAFFALFGDFRSYIEFFLLHDLVTPDSTAIRYRLPFDDFGQQATRAASTSTANTVRTRRPS
jgi:hypothetical protein